ncbi:MAG: hypothetical protein BWK75_02675 [Candidatus Altiarchaeales archaeon A3]|nr:MAG: hypothetical protein BWK75_02675 [Candidatus Altiarchaeales archaeon A3]
MNNLNLWLPDSKVKNNLTSLLLGYFKNFVFKITSLCPDILKFFDLKISSFHSHIFKSYADFKIVPNAGCLIFAFVLFAFVFAPMFLTNVSADVIFENTEFSKISERSEVIVENVNLNHTKDISLSADFKNNESKITAFSYNVLFDEREILSEKLELEKNETKRVNFMLPVETKNSLYDCKKHNLTFFIWVGGQKKTYSKEIIMQGRTFGIEISPYGKKCFSDILEMLVKDDEGNIVKNAGIIIVKDGAEVKRENTNMDGTLKFSPSGYGVGEYTITVKQHDKISDKFYCDKTIKFPVKGRMEIMHLPQYAKISDKVEIFIRMDEIQITSGRGGKKVMEFYNVEIFNKDTNQSNIFSFSSKELVFPLNFTSPGHYTITASRGDEYWTDSKDIEIVDKPFLNIDIQKNVKVGDVVTGKIFADDIINIDSLDVKVAYPDGSITMPATKEGKFSFTPPMSGDYEISVEDAEHKKNTVKIFALDEMFLEILPDEKNLKVGDTVRFRIKDSKNTTLNAEIYVNNERADTYYKIENLMNNISVKKDHFIPVNMEITVSGNNKINMDKNVLTYGEIQTIYATTEPETEIHIKIINKNNGEKIEKSGNFVEFMPSVGEYFAEGSKKGYLTANGTFTVMPAEINITIDYVEGEIIVKIFSKANNIPVQNAKFNVLFPGKKNLTLLTNEKGETKFKPDEWGNYVFTAEKENFIPFTSSKDIHTVDPVAITSIFIIVLIAAFFVYKYVAYRRFIKKGVKSGQPTGETGKINGKKERNIISTDDLKEEINIAEIDESPLSKIG